MDRRLTGALLLIAALALALVIPALDGRRLAGAGIMVQLPPEPRVGDCVLASPTGAGGTPGDSPSPFGPTFAACDDRSVAGEVVAVIGANGDLSAPIDSLAVDEINCRRSALVYSGAMLKDGRSLWAGRYPADRVTWDLTLNLRATLLLPSPVLRSAGQGWTACVAAPAGGEQYRGRLAAAFPGGPLPDEFGVCVAQRRPSVLVNPVPCGSPHIAELVATATVPGGGRTPVADIKDSCERVASMIVGRSDPTAAGQLVVEASITPAAAQFLALPQPLDLACYISSETRPLSGTLVGLGDRPIPFAS